MSHIMLDSYFQLYPHLFVTCCDITYSLFAEKNTAIIINYDIKYRMGDELSNEREES